MKLTVVNVIIRLLVATICGAIIGIERERHGSSAGFRTHILVCLGSAMTSLMSLFVLQNYEYVDNVFRISAQVVSGIGFLGAGMILRKDNGIITGLTTAAAMWLTATVGIAVGYGFYLGGLIATVIGIITTAVFPLLERKSNLYDFYCEISAETDMQEFINFIEENDSKANIKIIPAKSNKPGFIGINFAIKSEKTSSGVYNYLLESGKFEIITKTLTK